MRKMFSSLSLLGPSALAGLVAAVLFGAGDTAQAQTRTAGQVFRDCADVCPEMVVVPSGSFVMGSPAGDGGGNEQPQRTVNFARPFAVGRFEVTFAEWDACATAGACRRGVLSRYIDGFTTSNTDPDWGRGRRPVINIGWGDAQTYVRWLSTRTGQPYRLLSEAEWEYSARARTTTLFSTGDTLTPQDAHFALSNIWGTVPVGSFEANAFGLHDMHGNVSEMVEDCWNETYSGAPADGSAWTQGDCNRRGLRGGSWRSAYDLFSSHRSTASVEEGAGSGSSRGFRVARSL